MLVRVGSCKRCGRCCQGKTLTGSLSGRDVEILVKMLGAEGFEQLKKGKCKSLHFKRRKAVCKIYKDRPWFCQAFPAQPNDLVDGCGFSFKEVED